MTNVLPFPSAEKTLWDTVKMGVTKTAEEDGATQERTEAFLIQFEPIFSQFIFDYQLQFPPMDQSTANALMLEITQFQTALKAHFTKLLFERLQLEMKLFNW